MTKINCHINKDGVMSIFLKPKEYYNQDLNPVKQYIDEAAFYLHKQTNDPIEKCVAYLTDKIRNHKLLSNPIVVYKERDFETGDTVIAQTNLSSYIKTTVADKNIIAPTFTTYIPPTKRISHIVGFIDMKKKIRSVAKKAALKYRTQGDFNNYEIKNNEQNTAKTSNNSVSGTFATAGSMLQNPSAHSTLTSTIRSISSISNMYNEKVIYGNRYYASKNFILNNITTIARATDTKRVAEFMSNNPEIKYPTANDAMLCVLWSSDLYFRDADAEKIIYDYLLKLSPQELAMFVYGGDLYHFRKHNEEYMRNFVTKMIAVPPPIITDNPKEHVLKYSEDTRILANHILYDDIKGHGVSYAETPNELLHTVHAVCDNVDKVFKEYEGFLSLFIGTDIIPIGHAHVKNMIRRTVVLSDTDSTCASYQNWVEWYFGEIVFSAQATALTAGIMAISSQVIAHALAIYSANMNVEKTRLHDLAMKNEFYWDVMTPMNVRKHYFANTLIQEGNVYKKPDLLMKGVHLVSSNMPKLVKQKLGELVNYIQTTVTSNKKLSVNYMVNQIADLEVKISESIIRGDSDFLRVMTIKSKDSYKLSEEESPYLHYLFWVEALSKYYPTEVYPPFGVIKVPTTMDNPTAFKKWLSEIKNEGLKQTLTEWFVKYDKTKLATIYLPTAYTEVHGIPDVFKEVVDVRKVVLDVCNSLYLLLESMGIYKVPDALVAEYFFIGKH